MKLTSFAMASLLPLAIGLNTPSFAAETKERVRLPIEAVSGGQVGGNARLAIFVRGVGGPARGFNVGSVVRISKGTYCIAPNGNPAIDVTRAIPIVSVEWSTSSASLSEGVIAQWRSGYDNGGCADEDFVVLTFAFNGNNFVLSNGVSFTFIVP